MTFTSCNFVHRLRPDSLRAFWVQLAAATLVLVTKASQQAISLRSAITLIAAVASPIAAPYSGAAGTETNLGVLVAGQSLLHCIRVGNKGAGVLTITNVEASCECVRILSYPRQVASGDTGEIAVKVVAEVVGEFRYEVVVKTSDTMAPRKSFFLNLAVVASPRMEWPTRTPVAREQSLYLPVEDVLARMTNGETLAFVDVRDRRAYEAASISGAINLAPHAVKSAGFLRARTVVLVDEGWGNPALENESRRLTKMGLAAWILRGGMNAWLAAGGPHQPDRATHSALAGVQPRDYLGARNFDDWLVVDARGKGEVAGSPIPEAVNVAFSSAREYEFAGSVAGLVARRGAYTRVLVVGADGRENEGIRRALPAMTGCSVFFLAGGNQALREQLAMRLALAQSRTEHTGVPTSARSGQVIRKACGRCP